MNGRSAYSVRIEGAKYGASFGSALAISTQLIWCVIRFSVSVGWQEG